MLDCSTRMRTDSLIVSSGHCVFVRRYAADPTQTSVGAGARFVGDVDKAMAQKGRSVLTMPKWKPMSEAERMEKKKRKARFNDAAEYAAAGVRVMLMLHCSIDNFRGPWAMTAEQE